MSILLSSCLLSAVGLQTGGTQQTPRPDASDAATSRVALDPRDVLVQFDDMYARIVSADAERVTVEFLHIPGSRVVVDEEAIAADKLFTYREAQIEEGNAQAWLELARFAKEHDLHLRRIDALQTAAKLAPEGEDVEERLAEARSACAEARLAGAKELRQDGELEAAIEHLEQTVERFADCGGGADAEALLQQIRAKLADERARAAELQAKRRAVQQTRPELRQVGELIERGTEHLRAGRQNLDDYVEAKASFEDALAAFERARDGLAELEATRQQGQGLPAEVAEERRHLARVAKRRAVTAHVELGHVYVARGDRKSAYRHAGRAAVLAPDDARVADLRQAIAASATDGG
jgi:tetratricopeptide (TPR) repeat protein